MHKILGIVGAAAMLCAVVMAAPVVPNRVEHAPAGLAASPAQTDLDALMKKVVAQRDENWKKLQQYILDEKEQIEVHGSGRIPVWGDRREYSWFIREGYFIRSPTKVNGVSVSDADRRKAEDAYLSRAKSRDQRRGKGGSVSVGSGGVSVEHADPDASPQSFDAFLKQTRQPEFIESAYFLRFKFEEGKYAFVGREKFMDQDVLKIEYYPTRLFSHEQDKQAKEQAKPKDKQNDKNSQREDDIDATLERMMNKVSLVTIWVEPKANQIVKYTFDNVNFDFLPAAWLVRVSDLKASMTMSQAFKDIWLPRDVDMYFAAMLAVGAFDVHYHLDYHDYREASTSGRIRGGGGQ